MPHKSAKAPIFHDDVQLCLSSFIAFRPGGWDRASMESRCRECQIARYRPAVPPLSGTRSGTACIHCRGPALNERDISLEYRQVPPPPHLRRYIKCFWFLRGEGIGWHEPQRIVPDGCAELVAHLAEPLMPFGVRRSRSASFARLIGQYTRPIDVVAHGRLDGVGVRFWGPTLHRCFGVDAEDLTNRGVELSSVAPRVDRRLASQLAAAATFADRYDVLADVFSELLLSNEDASTPVERAVFAWHGSKGTESVRDVSERAGISVRQLQRRFRVEVGLSPKRFARVLRFQHALRALCDADPGTWGRVAYRCGYADQAHLIRDFRHFAGCTPSALVSTRGELAERFSREVAGATRGATRSD